MLEIVLFVFNLLLVILFDLYILQLESYSVKGFLKNNSIICFRFVVCFIFCFLGGGAFSFFKVKNIYILSVFFILIFCFLNLHKFKYLFRLKIRFTHRMIRIVCLIILFHFLFFCSWSYLNINSVFFDSLFMYLFNYLSLIFVVGFLYPLELCIGKYYLRKGKLKLNKSNLKYRIGITGSFGKTSTKEILNTLLSEKFVTLSTPKSYNTPFGISKTINNFLTTKNSVFICEMGAKKKGEIKFLSEYVNVDCGIVTSVGRQHLSSFGNIEGVYKTKRELPEFLNGKFCVFNLQNYYVHKMYNEYCGDKVGVFLLEVRNYHLSDMILKKKIFFKINKILKNKFYEYKKEGNVYAKNIKCFDDGSVFDVWYGNSFLGNVKILLLGCHNIINVLLSVAMAKYVGLSDNEIKIGLSKLKPIKARFEKFTLNNGATIINNGYNSNIDTISSSFKALDLFVQKNKYIITPGLIETSDDYLYNFEMGKLISKYFDYVVIVKEKNKKALSDGLLNGGFSLNKIFYTKSFDEAKLFLSKCSKDDVVLIENDLPDNFK